MKQQNEPIKNEMEKRKIKYDFYMSLPLFLEEFEKRYYNEIVICPDHYEELSQELHTNGYYPNIYVVK